MTTSGVAYWNSRFAGQVLVETLAGARYPLTVPPPRDPQTGILVHLPTRQMLAGSGWHGVPGQEWEEDTGGWKLNVFAFGDQPGT